VIRNFIYSAGVCGLMAPVVDAASVSVPEKSQPESITIAPNGDLILGSAASPKIYRAKRGSEKAEVFLDVNADGGGSFLGVLATRRPVRYGPAKSIRARPATLRTARCVASI
jgi:hypothetical protein